MLKIGIIGGSGLYEIEGLESVESITLETPFGKPSDKIIKSRFSKNVEIYFLPRHGHGHLIAPSEINYRANIYALKSLGVEFLLSVSAVGSMQEKIEPGHMVLPDQFFDRTYKRQTSFFEQGIVAHVPMAEPICSGFQEVVKNAVEAQRIPFHVGGTYVCIEGPQFSTKAESHFYRSLGAAVIGMTNMPEAKLAREAEMSYVPLSLATDFDCWHESEESVSVAAVMKVMRENTHNAKKVIFGLAAAADEGFSLKQSPFKGTVKSCIVSDLNKLSNVDQAKYQLWLS